MSAALIQQALAMGYNAKQILGFLANQIPGLNKGIKAAKDSGYPEQMILQFLTNQIPTKNRKGAQEQLTDQQQYLKNVGIKTRSEREEDRNQAIKAASQIGLGGVAAFGLGKSLSALGKAGGPKQPGSEMPNLLQSKLGQPSPGPQAPTQPKPQLGPQPELAPPAGQATAQTPGPLTPQVPRTPNPKHPELIKQMGLEGVIEGLQGKENPETISQVLEQHFLKPGQKKWLSEQTSEPLKNVVEDYLAQKTSKPETEEGIAPELREIAPKEPIESIKEETVNQVLTPSGDIGSLKSENKGIASVNVDGKQKNFREQDVIKAPIPEREIADIYQELIDKIPESERSAVINVAGYDPNHNELIFMPHGEKDALYVYSQIPPEYAEKLKNAMFKAKTTGENMYGAWSEGEASRGAGLYQLIKELQAYYGGKGKEYVRKYEKVYDFLAIPKAAIKDKEKKKREEERARQGKKPRKPRSS